MTTQTSSTKNVKIGVCKVYFDGSDLGYTKGGVEVAVKTTTHKTEVDQFGKTTIKETILGRDVTAKVPMAETTIDNMVAIMPGAVMTAVGGTPATGTITIATQPTSNQTILVNGCTVTFKTAAANEDEVTIGGSVSATATNLAAALAASQTPGIAQATYSVAGAIVTVTYGSNLVYGSNGNPTTVGNAFTLVTGTADAAVTMSGATLTGGAEPTSKRVDVTHGVGTDLLAIAKPLRFHPISKADTDHSEDFVIPLAATSGALKFNYKLEDERIYDVEFIGYPDSATGKLFYVGAD